MTAEENYEALLGEVYQNRKEWMAAEENHQALLGEIASNCTQLLARREWIYQTRGIRTQVLGSLMDCEQRILERQPKGPAPRLEEG